MNEHKILMWYPPNSCYAGDDIGQMPLEEKPTFSFVYETIRYYPHEQVIGVTLQRPDGRPTFLERIPSENEHQEILAFIDAKRKEVGAEIMAVDKDGYYLGVVALGDERIGQRVFLAPPSDDAYKWNPDKNAYDAKYIVNAQGQPVGHAWPEDRTGLTAVDTPPPGPYHLYDHQANAWVEHRPESKVSLGMLRQMIRRLRGWSFPPDFDNTAFVKQMQKNSEMWVKFWEENNQPAAAEVERLVPQLITEFLETDNSMDVAALSVWLLQHQTFLIEQYPELPHEDN